MSAPYRFVALVALHFVPGNHASAQRSRLWLWSLHLQH